MKNKEKRSIQVLLVDDHPVVLDGLKAHLQSTANINVVGEAPNGRDAILLARKLKPDVVLMDISIPFVNGIEATKHILIDVPTTKVLILSMHEEKEYIGAVLRAGARGYILKNSSMSEVVTGIRKVCEGSLFFSAKIAEDILSDYADEKRAPGTKNANDLSAREKQVLTLIAEGLTNKEIAQHLLLSVRTIETHRERIMRKLDIHTASGLTRYAFEAGIAKSKTLLS